MRWGLLVALVVCSTAAAAAGYIHNHHHLLGNSAAKSVEQAISSRQQLAEQEHQSSSVLPALDTASTSGLTTTTGDTSSPPEGCVSSPNPDIQAILTGRLKSYAFGGVPEDCKSGYGCKDEWYWGKWCRYQMNAPPQCPAELQEDLQSRLRFAASSGHQWAHDILTVRPCEVFPYMEGRTLWIIGDSMSKDFAFAFQCFMLEYWDEKPKHGGRWPVNSSLSPNVSSDPAVMLDVYKQLSKIEPGSETKPWYLQWCIPMASNTRMCYMRGNDGTFVANSLLPLLPRLASKQDLVLLNFGLHSKGNGTLWGYIQELKTFAETYDQLKEQLPQFIWRQTSVQHFANLIGEWSPDKPQQEQTCSPISGVELDKNGVLTSQSNASLDSVRATDMTLAQDTLLRGGRRNVRSAAILGRLGIPIMHIWNQTVPFWDFHRFYHDPNDGTACARVNCDCTHICVPSWHQMWMASLQKTLALVGRKGSARFESFNTDFDFPIPGINVPLRFLPYSHNVSSTHDFSVESW